MHAFALGWLDRYAGSGRDSVRENTRREYRRLLATFALRYFDREVRLRDLDGAAVQGFVDWLTSQPGRNGRLCDRSVANALPPLRAALDAAATEFARELRREGDDYKVVNGLGESFFAIEADPESGSGPTKDATAIFPTRAVALPDGPSAYSFTMFQGPGMPDELFDAQQASLQREFANIKRVFS